MNASNDQPGNTREPEHTPGPEREPEGVLGGRQPINADELAPADALPRPGDDAGEDRDPDAVEDEPGQDL